jgi:DHA2 family methylenomycin A resistance protein-like MFS transporter
MRSAPPRAGRAWTLTAATLGFAVVQLDVSVVNVAINDLGRDLGSGVAVLQWVVNAYTVTFAALILSAGSLGDRLGARRMFLTGFAVFTLASAACGLAPDAGVLIGARCVQGAGAALLVPCSLTLLNHTYAAKAERAHAVGVWAAGGAVALSGGPLVGGVLTQTWGWRTIFFINVPVGLLAMVIVVRATDETRTEAAGRIDRAGQLVAIVALGVLAAAMIEGGTRGFADPVVLAGLAFAAIAALVFVVVEHRSRRPLLPLELFRSRTFSFASAVGLVINIAFYGLIFVLSLFFQRQQGLSALQTGLRFAPMTVAVMIANLSAGRLAGRFGRAVLCVGALLAAAGAVGLVGSTAQTAYAAMVGPLVALGFGLGLVVPVMTSALLGSVPVTRTGVASGALNTARQAGSTVGVALFGSLVAGAHGPVAGLHLSLVIAAGLAVLAAILGLGIGAEARVG